MALHFTLTVSRKVLHFLRHIAISGEPFFIFLVKERKYEAFIINALCIIIIYFYYVCRNLICGRLICTYPLETPFLRDNASVIYAFVRSTVCITMHYETAGTKDPLVVHNGSICDKERVNSLKSIKKSILLISLVAQLVKNLPAMRETWVRSLDWEDPLEEDMATHFSILAWRIPWTEEPGGLQSMGPQRVGHD